MSPALRSGSRSLTPLLLSCVLISVASLTEVTRSFFNISPLFQRCEACRFAGTGLWHPHICDRILKLELYLPCSLFERPTSSPAALLTFCWVVGRASGVMAADWNTGPGAALPYRRLRLFQPALGHLRPSEAAVDPCRAVPPGAHLVRFRQPLTFSLPRFVGIHCGSRPSKLRPDSRCQLTQMRGRCRIGVGAVQL